MTFDKPTVRATRERLQSALDAVASELGCQIKVGSATFERDGSRCTFKIDCAAVGEDGAVETREASDFTRCATQYGLRPDDLGAEFTKGGETFTVIGCKPKSYKYPILARRNDGKVFKFPAATVRAGMDRPVVPDAGVWDDPEREAERRNALLG